MRSTDRISVAARATTIAIDGRMRLDALTGIRGIACLWVVVLHSYPVFQKLFGLPPEAQLPLVSRGYLAVDMFFMLSGFILTYRYRDALRMMDRRKLAEFAIARLCRIMPLNWVMLALLLATAWLLPTPGWSIERLDWTAFWASVFLVQSWGFANPLAWNFPAWSMSTEWAAYILFPPMVWCVARRDGLGVAVAGLSASLALLIALMVREGGATLDHTGLLSLPRCFLQFFAGMCLCRLFQLRRGPGPAPDLLMIGGLLVLVPAIFVTHADVFAPVAFAMIIAACAWGSKLATSCFATRPVLFLGEISFSLYLGHVFVIFIVDTLASGAGIYAAGMAAKIAFTLTLAGLLLAFSTATWRYVELPGQALGRHWIGAIRARG